MTRKPLLLIIDDLKSNRMIVKKVLKHNYNFIEACDGQQALEQLKSYTPDIILIDAIMPNMDGFTTIQKIRNMKKYKQTPILMITSLSDVKIKIKALEYGVNDFLTKPFNKYELIARCKSYVDMIELNRRFSTTMINPITGFKNEISLIKELLPNDAIFLFHINDFNKIKGTYGYKTSKKIEKEFGCFLKNSFNEDINSFEVYHIGTARYIVKLDKDISLDNQEIKTLCEKFFNNCIEYTIEAEEISFTPSPTIVYVKDRINLYEDAMSALGYARTHNIKYIYQSDDINGIKDIVYSNIEILKKVKDAINHDRIINFYQPIMDNNSETVSKYETLVRIKTDNEKLLSPNTFIDIAKNAQIYEDITKKVYKNAFDKFKFNSDEFSINISYLDIENIVVREYLFKILSENPHVSSRIIFEILEDKMIKDYGLINEFIQEVKKFDAKIAIDNFGEGYSGFQSILNLKPDFIKISGNIIKNILNDEVHYLLLENINSFAHNFNTKTIAEFVSSKELLDELSQIGIDYSQGYIIGKPSPTLLKELEVPLSI